MTLETIHEELQVLCGAQTHDDFLHRGQWDDHRIECAREDNLHRVLVDHTRDVHLIGLEVKPTTDACHGSSE